MKGKFKLLGHIGLALFLVSALVLAMAPVAQAATAVTEVWVDFPFTASINTANSTANHYYIHFKPTTALERGVDTVTVTFPDGSTAMGITAFSTISSVAAADLEFSTNYGTLGTAATWTVATSAATCGGYRVKVTTPIDVAADTGVWLRITSTGITSATVERSIYKVYVSTTKDTTPVLSSAFALGVSIVTALTVTPLVTTAGVGTQYIAAFTDTDDVAAGGTVTLKFPLGTTMPSTISTSDVLFSADGTNYSNATAATVDADLRTITGTTPVGLTDSNSKMKILSSAGVANPQTAATSSYKCMIRTSTDAKWFVESGRTHGAGSATKIIVANGEIGEPTSVYSDDATMINMASSYIYVTMADQYGNAKLTSSAVTVNLSSSSGTGTFYTCDEATPASGTGTYSSVTSLSVDVADPTDVGQQVYYKDTADGTHTLTFSNASYTDVTWTITVAPAISLYDSSDNLVNTYAATSTAPVTELGSTEGGSTFANAPKFGVDYINDAITAALAGDTIKLGDGIYELDAAISLNKKVTLTSVNGAAYTSLRPVAESSWYASASDVAIVVGISGTATNPVVVDGLTFDRLRLDTEFDQGVFNNGWNYVSVTNNIFNYVIPGYQADSEWGNVVTVMVHTQLGGGGAAAITSATVSNNTFNNCTSFTTGPLSSGNIHVITKVGALAITGVTISGNTISSNGVGISVNGYNANVTASITNNTITNAVIPIDIQRKTLSVVVTGNTITGGYDTGIVLEGATNNGVTIKNNTITGSAGAGIHIQDDSLTNAHYIQYNDIYDNNTYAIEADSAVATPANINTQYNWFGDASGPTYTALTGATISKSNPNGTGDKITDLVVYYPWLYKSRADVVADNVSYQTSNMKLVVGWNTMSTPVKLISTADSVDELIPSGMTIGYYYDGGFQQITTGYVLDACDAVYVKMSAATYVQFKVDAGAFSTPSKDLAVGWNLISLASLDASKDATDTVASVALDAAGLPGWSQVVSPSMNAAQTDIYGATETAWSESAGQTTATETMQPGLGYWCYMQNAATLAGFELTPIVPDLD